MSGWPTRRLADICSIEIGRTPARDNPKFWDTEKKTNNVWISISDMREGVAPLVASSKEHLSDLGASITPIVPEGALLLSFKLSLGKLAFAAIPLRTNEAIAALIPLSTSLLDKRFLYWFLRSFDWAAAAKGNEKIKGATLNKAKLKEIPVPLPPLAEQKRIVAILNEAFEGIAKATENAERNLANTKELFKLAIESRLTKVTASEKLIVRDLVDQRRGSIRTGPFGSQLLHSEFVEGGSIAVLGIDNVVDNEFTWKRRRFITREKYESLKRYTVKPGDVLISIMGTCGRSAVVPNNIGVAINSKHLCCITLDHKKCMPEFLHTYFLFHPAARMYLSAKSKGSIMDGLNMGIIQDLPVELPRLQEQRIIVEFTTELRNKMSKLVQTYVRQRSRLFELGEALMRRAFSGQLKTTQASAA